MSSTTSEGREVRKRPPPRDVVVDQVEQLTPQLIRVIVRGDLQNWKAPIPGGHFKLFVPDGDETAMRTYTVRSCDPEGGRLTIDFAIHAAGPATEWAKRAEAGQTLQISGMSRPGFAPAAASGFTLFVADHSALPAVAAIVEALPSGHRAKALIEIPTEAERIELATDGDLEVKWIVESGAPCERLVAAAFSAVDEIGGIAGIGAEQLVGRAESSAQAEPGAQVEYWVGCEADAMRAIRRHLVHERGIRSSALYTRAYWKQDVVNHPDHDTGDDVDQPADPA